MEVLEEKLLESAFGKKKKVEEQCSKCHLPVESPVYFNGRPFHPSCVGSMRSIDYLKASGMI